MKRNYIMTTARLKPKERSKEEPYVDYMSDGSLLPDEQIGTPMNLSQIHNLVARQRKIRVMSEEWTLFMTEPECNDTPQAMPYLVPTMPQYDETEERFLRQTVYLGVHIYHPEWTRWNAERWRDHVYKSLYPRLPLAFVGKLPNGFYGILKVKLDVKFKTPHTEDHLALYFDVELDRIRRELDGYFQGMGEEWKGRKIEICTLMPLFHDETARFADGSWGEILG